MSPELGSRSERTVAIVHHLRYCTVDAQSLAILYSGRSVTCDIVQWTLSGYLLTRSDIVPLIRGNHEFTAFCGLAFFFFFL